MKHEKGIQVAESANACVAVVDLEREPQLRHGRSRTVLMRLGPARIAVDFLCRKPKVSSSKVDNVAGSTIHNL